LAVLALLGLGLAFWRWWRRGRPVGSSVVLWTLLAVTFLVTAAFLELWMGRVKAPFGRLLFPALSAVALALVAGWSTLHPRLPLVSLAFLGALSVFLIPLALQPAYALPEPLAAEELGAFPDEPLARFLAADGEPVAALLQATPLTRSPAEGSYVPFELCWRTLSAPERNYTVLVHLVGPEDQIVGRRQTYPGLGRYPTMAWEARRTFCDRFDLYVDEGLPRSLLYRVEVALRDDEAGERLQAVHADGSPLEIVLVDTLHVRAAETPHEALSGAGPALRLLDSEVPSSWRAGETMAFSLRWGVAERVGVDYQLYVHLRDAATGETVDQADGPPVDGWYPTSYWSEDEIVLDERTFPLDANVAAGTYVLAVGFYDLATRERLGAEYELGPVEVTP
jgi:hypothetical protein